MVKEKQSDSQEKLEKFRQHLEEARKLQDELLTYGLEAIHLYVEDVDGDWLEKWGEDEEDLEIIRSTQSLVGISLMDLTTFLKSDDFVAVRIRKYLGEKSLVDVALELEKCLNSSAEDNQLCVVKNVLAGGETIRSSMSIDEEIELRDLAKSLLEKLVEIMGTHN
jgi:hypothetical protein